MNRGDAQYIALILSIDGEPITEGYADEIEATFNPESSVNCVRKTLSNGDITWNSTNSQYVIFMAQADTFKMNAGYNSWQIRLLKGNLVISTKQGSLYLGEANSRKELSNEET